MLVTQGTAGTGQLHRIALSLHDELRSAGLEIPRETAKSKKRTGLNAPGLYMMTRRFGRLACHQGHGKASHTGTSMYQFVLPL
jgi:hypothetical protein